MRFGSANAWQMLACNRFNSCKAGYGIMAPFLAPIPANCIFMYSAMRIHEQHRPFAGATIATDVICVK